MLLAGCSPTGDGASPLGSREDRAHAQAACLSQKGWDVDIEPDAGITWEGPVAQRDQYGKALEECRDQMGSGQSPDDEVTNEMLRTAYDMQVETLECLRSKGYDELSDPPTLQTYLDANGQWTPYAELPLEISEADWYQLLETCPQPSISPFG
jgi:hypothetical protein